MHVTERVYDAEGEVLHTIAYDGTIAPASYTVTAIATAITSLASRVTRFVYDDAGQVMYSIDALNRVTGYGYDAFGNVTRTTEFAATYTTSGDPALSAMTGWQTSNANATDDRTTLAKYDRDGRLRYSVDALGFVTRTDYDKAGHVAARTAYADANTGITDTTLLATLDGTTYASTPTSARITQYGYDGAGRLISTTLLEDNATTGNAVSITTYLVLDALGQVTSSTQGYNLATPSDTTNASTTAYEYDDAGRVVKQTTGSGTADASTTWVYYDALGCKAATVDGDNYLCVYTYDAAGQLTHETHYAGKITSTFGKTTSVASLIGLAGSVNSDVQNAYDAFGAVQATTDALGSVVSYDYDAIGEVKKQTAQMDPGTTADDIVTQYSYDNFGSVVKTIDARGNASFAYYDALGRVTRQVDAERFVTDTTYTRGDQAASVKRWHRKLDVSVTVSEAANPGPPTSDALDATTSFEYDKDDRLTKSIEAEGDSSGGSFQLYYEQYTLDAFGNRIAVRNKLGATSNYTFNKRGQVLTETLPITTWTGGSSPTSIAVRNTYSYDLRGNRTQMVEASGAAEVRTTNYTYDKLDRLTLTAHDAVTVTNADLTTTTGVVPAEIFSYDRRGNLIESAVGHLSGTTPVSDSRTLNWYDNLGHVIASVVQSDLIAGVQKGTFSVFSYDANGNRLTAKTYGDPITLPTDATGAVPSPVDTSNYRQTSYEYDRADRLKTTTVVALLTGESNGSTWATTTANVVTSVEYDMNGNVTRQVDGRGNSIYNWYDKLGRQVAQVDAENYLTVWTRDAEGNALSETRYANKVTGTFTPATDYTTLSTLLGTGATDANRVTTFTYDRNGRRVGEVRQSVAYATVSATNGALTTYTAASTVAYTYNGLGEVLTKVEANGDTTGYTYDATGRLTLETGQSFTDYLGSTVTPRTAYAYDGLNNLTAARVQIDASGTNANDRITTYTYGAGGRLATMTDAAGFTHSYGYDVAGRTVRDSYVRKNSAGADLAAEAIVYRYDLAGRVTTESNARYNGSSWVFTDADGTAYDAMRMRYDAYGEMTGRGVTAGPGATAAYQEVFDYDAGGRMWHSNSGDGVDRFYVYDKAGNQTLALSSAGANLSGLTLANYTASLTGSGGTSTSGAVTTITRYDRRGQAIATIAPDRELTAIGSGIATLTTAKTYNAFG
ncbi:hypothetical protein [Sphingomonas bacterium]|uniref:hypothetical protein n=1 Tax=Sphingomonas bacterium TaxID=1895847 RepID=UPI00260EDBB9|nr:hypothetical protein [Sphingomonas bacterium]MDB5678962.1 repeat protein [Sphingomonas bacterium]